MSEPKSLYVHIPFCRHICSYCDFAKVYYQAKWVDEYLECLAQELDIRQANRPFETVYIGGGSPSALNISQLERLFEILKKPLSHCKEATIEVNPEDLDESKARLFKAAGIQRVSMGVQTFNQSLLEKLDRHHDLSMIKRSTMMLEQVGISLISFDFIYGLPKQTMADLKEDLNILSTFEKIGHLSFYTLILEEHTRFYLDKISLKDDEWLLEAQQMICQELSQWGFSRYEVSNFCKPGQASKHNLVYWHNEHYIGIGMGASGYVEQTRYDNTKSLSQYLLRSFTQNSTLLTKKDQMFETLMLGLRLVEGVSISKFENNYGCTMESVFGKAIGRYIEMGLLLIEEDHLKTSPQGMDVLDEILVSMME